MKTFWCNFVLLSVLFINRFGRKIACLISLLNNAVSMRNFENINGNITLVMLKMVKSGIKSSSPYLFLFESLIHVIAAVPDLGYAYPQGYVRNLKGYARYVSLIKMEYNHLVIFQILASNILNKFLFRINLTLKLQFNIALL